MTDPKALEAARRIVDHQPNKHDWGYTAEVLLVARALLAGEGNSATAAAVPIDPWRPISTGPKDELIDIWIKKSEGDGGARWCDCYYDRICGEWRTSRPSGHLVAVPERAVTHWMHRAAPPGADASQQSKTGVREALEQAAMELDEAAEIIFSSSPAMALVFTNASMRARRAASPLSPPRGRQAMSEQTKADIVERLRRRHAAWIRECGLEGKDLPYEFRESIWSAAADEITRLRAERTGWREGIESAQNYVRCARPHSGLSPYISENGRHGGSPWSELCDAVAALHPSVAEGRGQPEGE